MTWSQFKNPVSHTCLADTVVISWSFTQKAALELFCYYQIFLALNSLNSLLNSVKTFRKNSIRGP